MKFSVQVDGNKITIQNLTDKPLKIKELRITVETTIITPEEKFALRKISDEIKLDRTLKPKESIEIRSYYTNIVGVSIIYEELGEVLREDHNL